MPADSEIIVRCGQELVRKVRVRPPAEVLVGRSVEEGILLESEEVSRLHAKLIFRNGQVVMEDFSTNGVFVEDVKAGKQTLLHPGAKVKIGPYILELGGWKKSVVYPIDNPREISEIRKSIQRKLIDHLDLRRLDPSRMKAPELRDRVSAALDRLLQASIEALPRDTDLARLKKELMDEALGLGPLEPLLADPEVSEIMVVDPETIFVERKGLLERAPAAFSDDETVRSVIERIVAPIGRRIDESSPLVDARLADGSRVNAIIPPLAIKGPCLTIRRFGNRVLELKDLVFLGAMEERQALFLDRSVKVKRNIIISGGTGSGKTTLLNALSAAIPEQERIVTIEDAAELRLRQGHVVSLEARPANMEGKGAMTIRDLVRNALRMRPDRIIVGECRGGEALDMLQAMNTGHDGSLTTLHANSPVEAVARLETMALMSGVDLPVDAIRKQIASSIHLVVQIARFADGSRRLRAISEITGLDDQGRVEIRDIFLFHETGRDPAGRVQGRYLATGYLPSFLSAFFIQGIVDDGGAFL